MLTAAYYLGQFHPIAENNQFWGEGFTEWHNVAKARPLFPGHRQPVLPGRLGFYDLRCEETLAEQLRYASDIGVNTLCHWHYWFGGKRVLNKPFEAMMRMPDYGVRFMLGWANESWTGVWHGLADQILLHQTYNREELDNHAKLIAGFICSDRYARLGDLAPFLIYKPRMIPDGSNYIQELRERVRTYCGQELYIIGTWGPGRAERVQSPAALGLDAVVANNVGRYFNSDIRQRLYNAVNLAKKKLGIGPELRQYLSTVDTLRAAHKVIDGTVHSTIVTGWDNTPRSGRRALVLRNYDEKTFRIAVEAALELERQNEKKIVFIKSWNEWAEGNTIEPKFHEEWSAGKVFADILNAGSL